MPQYYMPDLMSDHKPFYAEFATRRHKYIDSAQQQQPIFCNAYRDCQTQPTFDGNAQTRYSHGTRSDEEQPKQDFSQVKTSKNKKNVY